MLAGVVIALVSSARADVGGLRGAVADANSTAEMHVNATVKAGEDPRLQVLRLSQEHDASWRSTARCSMPFMGSDLTGVDVAVTYVSGDNPNELDELCCSNCDGNADCQFWVRETGTTGTQLCWLKKDPGSFTRDIARRGAFKVMLHPLAPAPSLPLAPAPPLSLAPAPPLPPSPPRPTEPPAQTTEPPAQTTQQPGPEALCSANAACTSLSGFCCPTAEGLKLGCCSETVSESPDSQHPVPQGPESPDSQHPTPEGLESPDSQHPPSEGNVMTLYHTTSSSVAEAIVATNFRPGSNGWCGAAIYFMDFPGLPKAKMDPVHSQTGAVIEATVDLGKICVIERPAGCDDGSSGQCCPAPNGAGFGATGAVEAGCNSIKWNPGDGWEYVIWEPERVLSKRVLCSGRSACLASCQATGRSLTECGGK